MLRTKPVVTLSLLLIAASLEAQVSREILPAPSEVQAAAEGSVVLEGREVPLISLISNFFILADHKSSDPTSWGRLLEDLELDPGSQAAGVLLRHVAEGGQIVRRSLPPDIDKDEIAQAMSILQVGKSWDLGRLWSGLLRELEDEGYDPQTLADYVDGPIRRGTRIVITGEDPGEIGAQLLELEQRQEHFEQAAGGSV